MIQPFGINWELNVMNLEVLKRGNLSGRRCQTVDIRKTFVTYTVHSEKSVKFYFLGDAILGQVILRLVILSSLSVINPHYLLALKIYSS